MRKNELLVLFPYYTFNVFPLKFVSIVR